MAHHPAIQRLTYPSVDDGSTEPCALFRLAKITILLLLISTGSNAHSSESNNTPPLLDTARTLHCAPNQSVADAALAELKSNTIPGIELPNQWFGTERKPQIHATTLNIVIDVILDSIERFPETTEQAESVLLGWNYCAVHHSGKYFDLSIDKNQVKRQQANDSAPNQWNGFERLGISTKSQQRYIPKAFSNTHKSTRQQLVYDWWAIQRNQCLPHPGTGEMYYKKTLFGPSKVISKSEEKGTVYPYTWNDDCALPYSNEETGAHALKLAQTEQDALPLEQAELTQTLASEQELKIKAEQHANEIQQRAQRDLLTLQNEQHIKQQQRLLEEEKILARETQREDARSALRKRAHAFALRKKLEKEAAELEAISIQQAERNYEIALRRSNPVPPVVIKDPSVANLSAVDSALRRALLKQQGTSSARQAKENKTQPQVYTYTTHASSLSGPEVYIEEEPAIASAINGSEQSVGDNLKSTGPQSSSTAFPGGAVPPFDEQDPKFKDRKYHGLSGSFALTNRGLDSGTEAWSFTANFGYKPIRSSYYFARTGFTVNADDSDPTYYWGIGYNDWHTGTWAFELNHWGPLTPGDGLQLENAVASISYKFDSMLLKKHGLSSSLSVNDGINSDLTVTLAGSWAPKPNWFIRTLITQPLQGGDTTWAYGFGYNDWRTQTWALEYNNWGLNRAFDPNFQENGQVTLSWKWGF